MAKTYDVRRLLKSSSNGGDSGGICLNETVTNLPSTTTETLIADTNINRCSLLVHNDSNKVLYLKYGSGVTSTNYSIKLKGGDQAIIDKFRGQVYGVWDMINGFAMITETTT